jgi:hypothetical protein
MMRRESPAFQLFCVEDIANPKNYFVQQTASFYNMPLTEKR